MTQASSRCGTVGLCAAPSAPGQRPELCGTEHGPGPVLRVLREQRIDVRCLASGTATAVAQVAAFRSWNWLAEVSGGCRADNAP